MITTSEIPDTEQGLLDYIRFGEAELKRNERRNKNLNETIAACRNRLTILGWVLQGGQWTKHIQPVTKGTENAAYVQTI